MFISVRLLLLSILLGMSIQMSLFVSTIAAKCLFVFEQIFLNVSIRQLLYLCLSVQVIVVLSEC